MGNPSESDMENGKASNPAVKKLKKDASKDDSTDVDDLLGCDSTSEDERRHTKGKDEKSKKDVVSEASIKKKREEKDKEREKRDKEREKEREERRTKVSPPKKPSPTKEKKRHNVIDSSDSEDNFDNDDSKDYNPSESDMENGKASNPAVKKLKI